MGDNLDIGMVKNPLEWAMWPAARAFLDPALALSDESWPEVEAELAADTMQLVSVLAKGGDRLLAAAVVRSAQTCRGEVLEIYLTGGEEAHLWAVPLATALMDGARAVGMVKTRIVGRPGWAKLLAGVGFRPTAMVLEAA